MQKQLEIEFKSLLTKEEYDRLIDKFTGNKISTQTNHYFDTARFSLKAAEVALRVREKDTFEITLKRKKRYAMVEHNIMISGEEFKKFKDEGIIPSEEIRNEIYDIIGQQKLINFLSLTTHRMSFPYKKGTLAIDKSEFLGVTDYEIEYEAKNYAAGKKEFIEIITELEFVYKKSEQKIKRAYAAYRRLV
jgi:uncharacterized protein YjbK